MVKVGIFGGSGYMGGEAVRVLLEHPEAEIAFMTSRGDKSVESFHRNFYGEGLKFVKPEDAGSCDLVFAALPSGQAMKMAPGLLACGTKIIDLGADFRLKDRDDWERKYQKKHEAWDLVGEAVYGIPELHREKIRGSRIVANPGCFSSAAILSLAPLVKSSLIETERIVVDGLSGTTGIGSDLHIASHHPEIANNIVPYNVVDHRHGYEIEQELGALAGRKVVAHFTSSYVPITRGILAICHCFPVRKVSRSEILDTFRAFYEGHPFVRVFDAPKEEGASWDYAAYPWVAAVSGTNYCHIGLEVDERRGSLVVFGVLDSIGKGGAHVAVQNMNLMFGLPEDMGLRRTGLHPY